MNVEYHRSIPYSAIETNKGEFYFAQVPHCASKAIEQHQKYDIWEAENIIALPHRIVPVANPISRNKTAWNFFHNLIWLIEEKNYPIACSCEKYHEFVEYTFNNYDRHWAPQSTLFDDIENAGKPTHYVRLDALGEIMTYLRGKPLAQVNLSKDVSIREYEFGHDDYMSHEIGEKFESDFELLDRALTAEQFKEIF